MGQHEEVVKKIIKEKLGMDDMVIERAHRVGEETSHAPGSHLASASYGSSYSHQPWPIVAKFCYWKQEEKVLKESRRRSHKECSSTVTSPEEH